MTTYSKISIASFTASLFLTVIFFAVFIHMYRSRFDFPVTLSPEAVFAFAVLTIGYLLVFIAVASVNIALLAKSSQPRWMPAAGLSMQGAAFIVMSAIAISPRSIPAEISTVTIVEHGHYSTTVTDSLFTEDGTKTKINLLSDIILIDETDTIPASLGASFGFRYTVAGFPSGRSVPIRIVNIYPASGLKDPRTNRLRKSFSRTSTARIGVTSYTGYTFEYDWELVPGEWTWQIWLDERKLAEKTFIVSRSNR